MKTYTIKQKMSNTGSIHDLASPNFDRDIVFCGGAKYAVVLAAYYGGEGYTTHLREGTAAAKSIELARDGYSHEIIDTDGNLYVAHRGELLLL